MRFARLAVCLATLVTRTECPRRELPAAGGTSHSADAASSPNHQGEREASDDAAPAQGNRAASWSESIRKGQWKDAEAALGGLSEGELKKPEVRYAQAKVALALGKHAEALAKLVKLEDELPLLREAVSKARAQAALVVGPFDVAAEWFGTRTTFSAWVTAAEAWEKAGEPARARTLCDRALAVDKKTRAQEERARTVRMRVIRAKEGDSAAVVDARWLAVHALENAAATAGTEVLDKEAHAFPLTAEELLARARILADAGRSDAALKTVERAANAAGTKPASALELCRGRAEAYYKARSRYPDAALVYRTCAALDGPHSHTAEDLFLSARAFSRADRDGDALPAFAAVMQKYPKTTWADQAEFHIARSHVLAGRWREGAQALDEYVRHYPKGHEKKEAERYRALAHLNAHDDKLARKLFDDLADDSEDSTTQARFQNLAAAAAFHDGDRTLAIGRWSDIARSRPLSWPALVARARLVAASAPVPRAIEPSEAVPAPDSLVVELPPPVDTLHRIGLDFDAEEAMHEREAVVVAKAQGRGTEALCDAYAQLDRGKRRFQISVQIPAALLASAPGPRNRWAWECAYPRPHEAPVRASETSSNLPANLLWAVMRQESAFDEEVVSPARAVGLLQLMPDTAKAVARVANLPHEEGWLVQADHNVQLGALYMRTLLDRLSGDAVLAAGAYNAGPEALGRWLAKAKGETLDVFVETIPFLETRGYVVRVMSNLARYGYLDRGEAGVPAIALDMK